MTKMTMCSRCNRNAAAVFVTKLTDGAQSQEGLCLKCAKELGIQPLNDFLDKSGMNEDDLQALNAQMGSLFEDMQNGTIKFEDLISAGTGQFGDMPMFPVNKNNDEKNNVEK